MPPLSQSTTPQSPDPSIPQSTIGHWPSTIDHFLPTLFPPAQLTLLLGHPGTGKSLLSLDLAARLSRGTSLDHNTNSPALTLIASREDDPSTISNRLRAANALTTHITQDHGTSLIPDHPSQVGPLIKALEKRRYALVILDPLPAFLGNYDCNHPASVRRLLEPLLQSAPHYNTAIVGIIHHNKSRRSPHASPFHTIAGSHTYTALARSVLSITTGVPCPAAQTYLSHPRARSERPLGMFVRGNDPINTSDPAHDEFPQSSPLCPHHSLTPLKLNAGPITHTFPFSIESITTNPEGPQSIPIIQWHTPIPLHSPQDSSLTSQDFEKSQLELACDFLRTALANGPLPAAALQKQARTLAISPRTLCRARQYIPLQYAHNGLTGTWQVALAKPNPECREPLPYFEPTTPVAVRVARRICPP